MEDTSGEDVNEPGQCSRHEGVGGGGTRDLAGGLPGTSTWRVCAWNFARERRQQLQIVGVTTAMQEVGKRAGGIALEYRVNLHHATGRPPAEVLIGRELRQC
ncbi:unnamed protein product [Haemonchus placei]|uniref:Uncharacterized protein n=1 Tax=Haemonchus placei TaxID=6290 RepID=A0A0N4W3S9_HAEPC|nr:unnamed protein product [Haemonchus placei]